MKYIKLILLIYTFISFIQNSIAFHGKAEKQGLRPTMEDACAIKNSNNYDYFGLFDGHGGRYMADYASKELYKNIILSLKDKNISSAISKGFELTHQKADYKYCCNTGCTAIMAILEKDDKSKFTKLYIGNVGDSRAVVSKNGAALPLSVDHKPDRPDELERIKKLGGFVKTYGVPRTMGILAMSRALGDKNLNPFVTPEPEIYQHKIESDFKFLILACDGVWDVLSNQEAVDLVAKSLKKNNDYTKAALDLIDSALEKGSTDNVSAIIIDLKNSSKK